MPTRGLSEPRRGEFLTESDKTRAQSRLACLSLGIYATVWGFRRVPIADEYDREHRVEPKRELAAAF
jgi:hypothetical protein